MNKQLETDPIVVEAIEMGDVDVLEEDLLPSSFLCTGCSCECK